MTHNTLSRQLLTFVLAMFCLTAFAADREAYIKHSSGLIVGQNSDGRAVLLSAADTKATKLTLRDVGGGYYLVVRTTAAGAESYLTLNGSWNTFFEKDATTDNAKYAIEGDAGGGLIKLRNKSNGRYLGTDSNDAGAYIYSDKNGSDAKHYWYLAEKKTDSLPTASDEYIVATNDLRQKNVGWGVSLCWWARMCGEWQDKKVDELVDWLVSPNGLNYNIFRYNIGGGDDPDNKNCEPHHMGKGKGLRAEMEGFKVHPDDEYDWTRDKGQRKIMLKIKEKRPDAIFEAFSNSAPWYMTHSGCCGGNFNAGKDNLKPECYEEFAHYLVDVCKHYKDEYGIEFLTLEPFNEPVTNYWGASGSQEGCHFDATSQVDFIKVLAPILKASGLSTVISASDETNVGQGVATFQEYKNQDVLGLIGQWNVHTYGADNVSRSRMGTLAREAGLPFWMSETGSGGDGIGGNLALTQRMFDDIRYMLPDAWVDWQYVEENNDQWCLVRGSFGDQTYQRVKNYYVRQQVTRHIKQGYRFVTSLSPNTLAAVNENCDTLVLVVLNAGATASNHKARILGSTVEGDVKAYQTSATKNHAAIQTGFSIEDGVLTYKAPSQTITTFIIPVTPQAHSEEAVVEEAVPCLVMPQYSTSVALASDGSTISIENIGMSGDTICVDASQVWTFSSAGDDAFRLTNANGDILTATSGYALTAARNEAQTQRFEIAPVDEYFVKIAYVQNGKCLDLERESVAPGTRVGLWDYGTQVTAGHRNWHIMPLVFESEPTAIDETPKALKNSSLGDGAVSERYTVGGVKANSNIPGVCIIKYADGTVKKAIIKR